MGDRDLCHQGWPLQRLQSACAARCLTMTTKTPGRWHTVVPVGWGPGFVCCGVECSSGHLLPATCFRPPAGCVLPAGWTLITTHHGHMIGSTACRQQRACRWPEQLQHRPVAEEPGTVQWTGRADREWFRLALLQECSQISTDVAAELTCSRSCHGGFCPMCRAGGTAPTMNDPMHESWSVWPLNSHAGLESGVKPWMKLVK